MKNDRWIIPLHRQRRGEESEGAEEEMNTALADSLPVIDFTIPGDPIAKGRPRFAKRGNFVATFTPKKTSEYERLVKLCSYQAMFGRAPFDAPIYLAVDIYLPIPTSWSKRKQIAAAKGEIGATKKPDADNVLKAVKDAMNGIVYTDDSRVTDVVIRKRYSPTPRVHVMAKVLPLALA